MIKYHLICTSERYWQQCGGWIGGGSAWRKGDQLGGDSSNLKEKASASKPQQAHLIDRTSVRDLGYKTCCLCRLQSPTGLQNHCLCAWWTKGAHPENILRKPKHFLVVTSNLNLFSFLSLADNLFSSLRGMENKWKAHIWELLEELTMDSSWLSSA